MLLITLRVIVSKSTHAVVDTYGGMAGLGGGAVSGLDDSFVVRSAAFAGLYFA
jgi:S-adenosylmethionine synthetase